MSLVKSFFQKLPYDQIHLYKATLWKIRHPGQPVVVEEPKLSKSTRDKLKKNKLDEDSVIFTESKASSSETIDSKSTKSTHHSKQSKQSKSSRGSKRRKERKKHKRDQAEHHFKLGVKFETEGPSQNLVWAVNRYELAGGMGHAGAQFNLGAMFDEGRGVEQSFDHAVKLYRKAAEQGHAEAQERLGNIYYYKPEVRNTYPEWARFLGMRAAERKDIGMLERRKTKKVDSVRLKVKAIVEERQEKVEEEIERLAKIGQERDVQVKLAELGFLKGSQVRKGIPIPEEDTGPSKVDLLHSNTRVRRETLYDLMEGKGMVADPRKLFSPVKINPEQEDDQQSVAPGNDAANVPDREMRYWLKAEGFDAANPEPIFGGTPILRACELGRLDVVRYLVRNSLDNVRARDSSGRTAFLWAVMVGSLDLCRYLHRNGAKEDVTVSDHAGRTPIFWACFNADLEMCQWLYRNGASNDVRIPNNLGRTPTLICSLKGHLDCLQWLARTKAGKKDHATKDKLDKSPMYWAAANGHFAVCQWLICQGVVIRAFDFKDHPAMRRDLESWIKADLKFHFTFINTLLWGTRPESGSSHLHVLGDHTAGTLGINVLKARMLIGEFLGVLKGEELMQFTEAERAFDDIDWGGINADSYCIEDSFSTPLFGPAAPCPHGLQCWRHDKGLCKFKKWHEAEGHGAHFAGRIKNQKEVKKEEKARLLKIAPSQQKKQMIQSQKRRTGIVLKRTLAVAGKGGAADDKNWHW